MTVLKTDFSVPKPAFVALGDVHLSGRIWGSRPDVTGDDILGLENVLTVSIDQGKVPIVLVGDIFDTAYQADVRPLRAFQAWVDRVRDRGISVYALQGNHDRRAIPWYAAAPHVQHIGDGRPLVINGVSARGFDFDLLDGIRGKLQALAADPLPQVLFLHQAARQALKFDGAWNCDLEDVPPGIPLTVLADLHGPYSGEIRPGQEWAYTNSGHPRSTSEFGDRSILVVNQDLSWRRVPVPTRPMRHEIWTSSSAADLTEWLLETSGMARAASLAHFLKLTYSSARVEEVRAFKGNLPETPYPVLFWDEILPDRKDRKEGVAATQKVPGPREVLEGLLPGPENAQALNLALDLITTPGALPDCLQAHRVQFLETYGKNR